MRTSNRRLSRLSGLTCLALVTTVVSAADVTTGRELVVAMAADDSAALGTQLGYRALQEEGAATKVVADCMQKVDRTAFTDLFAKVVADQLTAEEIQQALTFYQSDVGKKFVQAQSMATYEQFGYTPPQEKPLLSDADTAAVDAFGNSPAGLKLLSHQVLTDSEQGRAAARAKILELQRACERG